MAEMAQMKAALAPLASGCHGDHRAECPILSQLSRGATPTLVAPELKPKSSARRAAPASTRNAERTDHGGLVAWMQSLNRVATAEHA